MGAAAAEADSIKMFDALMAAKKKEVLALTKEIETKLERVGTLGVEIAQMENDLGDTEEALIADKEFLANLDQNCETKKKGVGSRCEDTRGGTCSTGRHDQGSQ